jgi:poly(A) polymerase
VGVDVWLLFSALMQQPVLNNHLRKIAEAAKQTFPVSASDLMPRYSGPALGRKLKELEARWISTGFALSKEDLLSGL